METQIIETIPLQRRAVSGAIAALTVSGLIAACGGGSDSAADPGVYDSQLAFDKTKYTTITVTLDGVATPVRWYREVCYVGKPMRLAPQQPALGPPIQVDNQTCGYQNMNIFVREVDAAKQDNAILLNVNNAGWFASYQGAWAAGMAAAPSPAATTGEPTSSMAVSTSAPATPTRRAQRWPAASST